MPNYPQLAQELLGFLVKRTVPGDSIPRYLHWDIARTLTDIAEAYFTGAGASDGDSRDGLNLMFRAIGEDLPRWVARREHLRPQGAGPPTLCVVRLDSDSRAVARLKKALELLGGELVRMPDNGDDAEHEPEPPRPVSEPSPNDETEADALGKLKECEARAYRQRVHAQNHGHRIPPGRAGDADAHAWLSLHGDEDGKKPVSLETWRRYLRAARRVLDQPNPRHTRQHGSSIAHHDQI